LSLKLNVPSKLAPFVTKRKRYKVAFGGRGGAKSMTIAGMLVHKAQVESALVGCLREFQNSLDDSVYALMVSEINRMRVPGYKIRNNKIDNESGGGMRFRGLARSVEAIKSLFGFKYFWLEEGQFISDESLKILTPTLREEGSELWISANALNSADPFSQRFIIPYQKEITKNGFYEDDLHYIVKINYNDNPWFPEVLEAERKHDKEHMSRAMYDHIWEGAFNDSVEDSIIQTEWFDAAVDAHKKLGFKPKGVKVVSHDPSDMGTDNKGLVYRHGSIILEATERQFGDVNEGADWAVSYAIENQADMFVWDTDGMGVSLKRQVEQALEGKKITMKMFSGAKKPEFPTKIYKPLNEHKKQKKNREVFKNRRAQYYWYLRDRFYRTFLAVEKGEYHDPAKLISISSSINDLALLRSEVCRIPRKYNAQGMIQIMNKKEMLKLKIQSPNIADSLMMSLVKPRSAGFTNPLQFATMVD